MAWAGSEVIYYYNEPALRTVHERGINPGDDWKKYHDICDRRPPTIDDPYTDAENNLERLENCHYLRLEYAKNFYGGKLDGSHQKAIGDLERAISKAEKPVRRYCEEKECE